MPELPEVEIYKRYLESTSLNKRIESASVERNQMLFNVGADKLERLLAGRKFQSCWRHGKYLFAELRPDLWLVLHFGMTGNLIYFKGDSEKPHYTRLLIRFNNGHSLAFTDQRKFGKISINKQPQEFIEERNLGPDALQIDFRAFKTMAARSRGAVKGTLLDQHRIAGLGNLYADEALFQTRIHPQAASCALSEQTLRLLFKNIKRILQTAIKRNADYTEFPKSWLLVNRVKGGKCPRCPGRIATTKVAGRTTYFCPSCQKMPQRNGQ